MTHFHDAAIKEALFEIAPAEKQTIDKSTFGEITGSYVCPCCLLLNEY